MGGVRGRFQAVRWRAVPAAWFPLLLFGLVIVPPRALGASQGVAVALAPIGPTSIPQGFPLTLRATATNPDPDPQTVGIVFHLTSPGGSPLDFERWTVTVPGLGSARYRVSVTPAQWFDELGAFQVEPLIQGQPVGDPLPFTVLAPAVPVPTFADVTEAAGLSSTLPGPTCYRFGSGAGWGDANGDGLLDLYVPLSDQPAQLWVQDAPGHFADQAAERGVDDGGRVGMGAVFVDYDNDGDQDIYVTNDGPNRLYRNDGTGHFTDVAPQARIADGGAGPSASWGDYDGDGYLDLYVTNYRDCAAEGQPDKLYHSEGDGTFTDQTGLLGDPEVTAGVGYQAAWFDYDGDGDQDLYVANDKLPTAPGGNHLWRNEGPGQSGSWLFTEVSAESGTDYVMASMGIGIADFDHDLDLDMAISNIQGNVLARNNGDGTFTDVAADARVERSFQNADLHSITWGLAFFDLNLDAWEDLYVAAGSIADTTPQPNEIFVADGRGRFLDLSAPSHAADDGVSRGVAFADYDRDGRIDMYVVDQWGSPRLYHNVTETTGRHWLEVDTVGTSSVRDGCGARLLLTAGTERMLREVFCGSISLSSGPDATVHFGLGTATTVSRLMIQWPSGTRQVIRNLDVDQVVTVNEPAGPTGG